MRTAIALTLVVALFVLSGCALNRSERGGEVSTSGSDFRISAPLMETTVRQGDVRTVTVNLNRGQNFTQDVNLKVNAPRGLNVEPSSLRVRAGDREDVQLVITADENAALAVHNIEVQAEPQSGKSAWVQFPVRVTAR